MSRQSGFGKQANSQQPIPNIPLDNNYSSGYQSQPKPSGNNNGFSHSTNQNTNNYNSGGFYQDAGYNNQGTQPNSQYGGQDKNSTYTFNQQGNNLGQSQGSYTSPNQNYNQGGSNQYQSQGNFGNNNQNYGYDSLGNSYGQAGGNNYGVGQSQNAPKQSTFQSTPLNIEPKQSLFACEESELDEIFEVFQKGGRANTQELIEALKFSGIASSCAIVIDKINDWVANNRTTEVNEYQFKNFFRFNLQDENDFKFVFKLIDDQRGVSGGIRELSNANKKYGNNGVNDLFEELGLTPDDMRLMVDNLKTGSSDSVNRLDLFNVLYGKNAK